MKQIKKVLFNKNRIFIQMTENIEHRPYADYYIIKEKGKYKELHNFAIKENIITRTPVKEPSYKEHNSKIVVRRKSPLGFYYDHVEYKPKKNKHTYNDEKSLIKYEIYINNYCYTITFYIEYNGSQVSIDTRPWELCYESEFSDNDVKLLLKVMNGIFDDAKKYNTVLINKPKETRYLYNIEAIKQVEQMKNEIYVSLFGHKEGPKFQTNEEKILSHGFDLKTSFRNVK